MDINSILYSAQENRASDVHLTVNLPPVFRIDGELRPREDWETLTSDQTEHLAGQMMDDGQLEKLEKKGQVDLAYSIHGSGRFRVSVFKQRGCLGIAIRIISSEIKNIEELGLPQNIQEFSKRKNGLVLVTGPTGSGKSSTLAALIDYINRARGCHIITLEDPIEFMHSHRKSIVNQREIESDTEDFALGLRSALRQDPDVILVGEMRDLETIGTAITAAETGHLVFATLHTNSASQSVERIIDVFPSDQQKQIRMQLAATLEGIVTQNLLPRKDGQGRVPAAEVLMATHGVRNLIREGKTHQLYSLIQTGKKQGMQTMEAALSQLAKEGKISSEFAPPVQQV